MRQGQHLFRSTADRGTMTSIRILFVDDEPGVLQALQRSMHAMRGEWATRFASSGAAALVELSKSPADVIVSDMQMPGMDGWALLREVKQCHPQMVRLILSGHADPCSIMRTVGIAHQYLAKPCESAALKAAILQTYSLRQLLSDDRLALLVGRVEMLPSAPKVFQEILTCLQAPTASVADAARIIGRDLAMTANVIKLVNSAFFGSRQPITTASRAVAYLGLDTLGALVLGHSAFKSGVTTGIAGYSLERLWKHSLDAAVAARTIALFEHQSPAVAEIAFLAGILHDIGKVVYATRAAAADAPAASIEEATVQMDAHHAEVGAYLLGLWGFPNSIVEAVAFHHSPSLASGEDLSLSRLVHIADRLVHQPQSEERQEEVAGPVGPGLEPGLLEKLGLAARWPEWLAALRQLDSVKSAA
jgi:putative nucleotidyltransferase with HDIG domain